jgi:hypothetical protein
MSQRPEYIQLETNDDVPHVRDRLSFIRGRRVLIVWPEHGTALTRKLDLVLIQREARRRSIQLALVTHDTQVMQHAEELGISVFETIGAAERGRWKRGRAKIFTQRYHKPASEPNPEELIDVASRVRNPRKPVSRARYVAERLVVLALLLGVMGATAYAVVPSAVVTITLASEQLTTKQIITADPALADVDVEGARMPATIVRAEVQTSGTVQTSGVSALGDKPAIGIVVFSNETVNNVTVPAGTRVSTGGENPVVFATIAEITLRGGIGNRQEVAIEAVPESAGSAGNVDPGAITVIEGPLRERASVLNLTPTTGGETRRFATVTQEDRDRLLSIVRGQLQASAYQEMQASLSATQLIVIETIRIAEERSDWTTFTHEVGAITDTLTLSMRAIVEAIVIDDRFSRQIIFARLSTQKPAGKVLLADTFSYERGAVTSIQNNQVMFEASGTVTANATLDTTALAERLAGRSVMEAQAVITQLANLAPGVVPAFSLTPEGFPHLPLLPVRITIVTVNQ